MSMRPKPPSRPKAPGSPNENAPGRRDTGPDSVPGRPVTSHGHQPDPPPRQPLPGHTQTTDAQAPAVEIFDLPAETHISRVITDHPISNYFLPPAMVDRLPAPDPQTGVRSIVSGRQYVDLADGGTVLLGSDWQGQWRARQPSELTPSGPRLVRVEGTLTWRVVQPHSEPWQNWGIGPQQASTEVIAADGVHYQTLPRRDAPEHPIAYIKNPAHPGYDFDLLEAVLRHHTEQQPRGAIQVPPAHHWQIDPTLPFDKTLTEYVGTYFADLSQVSQHNVARQQFVLANGSDTANGAGLTTLRQVFNDWKTLNATPRPELADPLLMLPVMPTVPGNGTSRILELPAPDDQASLQRLTFDPQKFRQDWSYFSTTQYPGDIKRFMEGLLTRNGYTVFEPTPAQAYPALVFRRTGHDFVFYMTLHRILGKRIHIPSSSDRGFAPERLPQLIGVPALRAVQNAEAANTLIWLKGGSHISADYPSSVFIVRSDDPRH